MLETLSLKGKTILITGGGTGLGLEMVRATARAGADLVISARRLGPIEEAVREVKDMGRHAMAIQADITDSTQVNRMMEIAFSEFGKIDVLINNAGIVFDDRTPIWDVTDEDWQRGINGNLTGTFYCCRAVAKHMVEQGNGRIINLATGYALRGERDNYMYGCAKAATLQLSRSLTMSLSRHGVTAVTIVPGYFPTHLAQDTGQMASRAEFIPVGRFGAPTEIGLLVVLLASDASSYLNGDFFAIDGGSLAGGFAPTTFAPEIPLP